MNDEASAAPPTHSPRSSWLKRWLQRAAITLALLAVVGVAFIGYAEHETAKPDFCGSCHIMEPYHESWQADLHGAKLDVKCVDCHYAPGERTTVNAKLRGLSQVASYVSGRYGAMRPRAHVSDQSCMTAKCHGDQKFMDKVIELGTVRFTHASHLNIDPAKQRDSQSALEELTVALRAAVGNERFAELEAAARESGEAKPRIDKLVRLVNQWRVDVSRDDLQTFSQLHHRQVRVAQLADIQCTNCHSYVSPDTRPGGSKPAHHFSVSMTSCYTCHFNNEGFNTGTNTCLMCHTLPTQEITVHAPLTAGQSEQLESPELAAKAVKMNHQAMLERKVDCISCHADVAMEDSLVTRRDCERCHDLPRYFEDWKQPFTLDLVAKVHKDHVPHQRAKCLDCHTEIHHQLVRDEGQAGQSAFLSSVMANCTHCHPNHHAEQLSLLHGTGGATAPHGSPNLMFGSRTNCYGCHTAESLDEDAGNVVRATLDGCIACHGDRHVATFEKWKQGLEFVQMDAEEAYAKANQMLEEAQGLSEEARAQVTDLLAQAKADLRLVKRGRGLHNVQYAIDLLDGVTRQSQQAMAVMSEAAAR